MHCVPLAFTKVMNESSALF